MNTRHAVPIVAILVLITACAGTPAQDPGWAGQETPEMHPAKAYLADHPLPLDELEKPVEQASVADAGIDPSGEWLGSQPMTIARADRMWRIRLHGPSGSEVIRFADYKEGVLVCSARGVEWKDGKKTVRTDLPALELHAIRVDGNELLVPDKQLSGLSRYKLGQPGVAFWRLAPNTDVAGRSGN